MTNDLVSGIRHEPWPLLTTVVAVWGVVALVSLGVALGEGDGPRLETIPWDHLLAIELMSLTTWVVLSLPGLALLRELWTPPRHPILGLVAAALGGLVFSLIFNGLERQVLALVTTPAQETFAAMILPDLDARIVGFLAMVALVRVTPALAREERRHATAEGRPLAAGVPPLVIQLQSHFLFNTLNDAAELVHVDPDAADDVITRLSEFLRAALVHTRHEVGTLGQELRFVRSYTEIQAVRLRDRLTVEWDIAPDTLEATVPVFIWQPILENAFRYGTDSATGRVAVEIGARREGTDLILWIRDSGTGGEEGSHRRRLAASPGQGIGLRNTRDRVARLYGASGSVQVRTLEQGTIAVVRLPFVVDRNPSAATRLP